MTRSNSRNNRSQNNSNLEGGGLFGKREAITNAKGNQLYDSRVKTKSVQAYRNPAKVSGKVSGKGLFDKNNLIIIVMSFCKISLFISVKPNVNVNS